MYAANKIYDYPIAVLDLQHAIKFNPVTAETTECPSVLGGFPVDFGDCSDCKMFVDCIGFDVFCKIQLEKNTSKLIEAKNNGK
jgi:hypothetical protein